MKKTNGRSRTNPHNSGRTPKLRRETTRKQANNIVNNQHMNTACYARCGMQCICVHGKGKDEPGMVLANQVCRWIDGMISVEIDIQITGIGCTVCKWQAKQEWHESEINSMMLLSKQQEIKLLHPNVPTKHMAMIYSRCLTKDEH